MDSLIAAAARSLSAGDAIGALKHVGTRDDAPALALRGIAMAQLGVHPRARELLRLAARTFGPREPRSRARCIVAEAEIALAMRDLGNSQRALVTAAGTLEALGDQHNAQLARLVSVRRLLLLGQLASAAEALAGLDAAALLPSLQVIVELTHAEIAMRSLRIAAARTHLARAAARAAETGVPALLAEVDAARGQLDRPAARRIAGGREDLLRLDEVAVLFQRHDLVVDACRRGVRLASAWVPLARRPVLFALVQALAAAAPGDVPREALIRRAFRIRRTDETHRARLRVELGRLRTLLAGIARIEATPGGFALRARSERAIILLAPPLAGDAASLQALLGDGNAWSTSALALATGTSQRTVQRSLAQLEREGRVRSIQRGRAHRWLAPPLTEITTILLLPAALPLA